jgi:hypothetical protein
MATPKESILVNPNHVGSEIDRLIASAKLRAEHQRIHIRELAGNLAERTRARGQLKAMIQVRKKLRAIKRQFEG